MIRSIWLSQRIAMVFFKEHHCFPLLNQARAWFLKIDIVRTLVCVYPPPGLLKTSHEMKSE